MNQLQQAAAYYVSRGWPVFPIHGLIDGATCTCGDPTCDGNDRGKHPATNHGHKDATLDPAQFDVLFTDGLTRNIAIVTGRPSNLAVVDIDPRHGGFDAWDEFEDLNAGTDFGTYTVTTGGGGLHLYYSLPDDGDVPCIQNLLRGVDLKASGGYVLAPPSSHASGGVYATVRPALPIATLPDPVLRIVRTGDRPAGLKHTPAGRVSAVGLTAARQREILEDPSQLGPGERDTFFTFTARDLRRGGYSAEHVAELLGSVYERMTNPADDEFSPEQLIEKITRAFREVEPEVTSETRAIAARLAKSAVTEPTSPRYEPTPVLPSMGSGPVTDAPVLVLESPGTDLSPAPASDAAPAIVEPAHHQYLIPDDYTLPPAIFRNWEGDLPDGFLPNDDGVALLAEVQWGHQIRYDRDADDWLYYDEEQQLWLRRAEPEVTELVKLTIRSLERVVALDLESDAERAQMIMFVNRQLNAGGVGATLRSLRTRASICLHHDDFDNQPFVLPVENGVLEPTEFGHSFADVPFRDHRAADLFTRRANLRHDSHPVSPVWDEAISRWFPDPTVAAFARRLMGYAVLGGGQEKVFVVAYGPPDSGKSAFFNNVRDLLGELAEDLDSASLLKRRFEDQARFDLAHISGARLLLASETEAGAQWDDALIKRLTSGGEDAIRARFMRENFVTIRNKALLIIMSNHVPTTRNLDEALWRRLTILPFSASFAPNDPTTLKPDQLKRLLYRERDGVLRWLVEGYADYVAIGLSPPEAATEAVAAVREEQDWLGPYVRERLTEGPEATHKALMSEVTLDYEDWCREVGDEPVGARQFRASLGERFRKARGGRGRWYFYGCELKNAQPVPGVLPESWR